MVVLPGDRFLFPISGSLPQLGGRICSCVCFCIVVPPSVQVFQESTNNMKMQSKPMKPQSKRLLAAVCCALFLPALPARLFAQGEPVLAPVVVEGTGEATQLELRATPGAGFQSREAGIGALGNRSIQDTPYSISVIPSAVIENTQATSLNDLLKYIPSAQMEARGGLDVGRPQTRGFESSVAANNHLDGFNVSGTTAYPMELFERVEVIASLTGALYGPASPAGNFNYIAKRPTRSPLSRFTLGYGEQSRGKFHADLSRRVGNLGLRVNLLQEEGRGYVEHSALRRKLGAVALDYDFTSATKLEINLSHYEFVRRGFPGGFSYGAARALPSAPDPTRAGFGQPGAGLDLVTNGGTLLVKHAFNDNWKLSAGIARQIADRGLNSVSNTLLDDLGNYRVTVPVSRVRGRFIITSHQFNLNGVAHTGGIRHELSLGANGFIWDIHAARVGDIHAGNTAPQAVLGVVNLHDPQIFPSPQWTGGSRRYHSSESRQRTLVLGDTLTFNEKWSALAVVSQSWLKTRNFNAAGVRTGGYEDDGISPTVAILFKPHSFVTTYAAYADSLQQGDSAPVDAANAGQALAPYRSEQYELGLKVSLGSLDARAALFRTERPFAYTDPADNIFREQGKQRNYGLELMANGEVFPNLFVYSGLTLLDPRLLKTVRADTRDKRVVGVPRARLNVLLEYQPPQAPGLVLTSNVHYTSRRAANDTNTTWADSYATLDLGARYTTRIAGKTTVWRLGINNVTDKKYWASIFPGSINGTGGSASAFLGTPREVQASVSFDL
jgi:iron complex outermembrane receptor protein